MAVVNLGNQVVAGRGIEVVPEDDLVFDPRRFDDDDEEDEEDFEAEDEDEGEDGTEDGSAAQARYTRLPWGSCR